jgi:hypothetical protein
VRVVVLDAAGRPVAGARVTALVVVGLAPGETPADEVWKDAVRLEDPAELSGGDGVAVLRGVPQGHVGVNAVWAEGSDWGWSPTSERGGARTVLAGPTATVEIRLEVPQPSRGLGWR